MKDKITTLTASVPASLNEAVRKIADANDRSVSAEVRIAIRNHVEQCNKDVAA